MRPHVLYLLLIIVVVWLLAAMAVAAWPTRRLPGGRTFVTFLVAAASWCLLIGAMALSPPEISRWLLTLKYVAIAVSTVSSFVFITERIGQSAPWSRRRWALVLLVPLAGAVASARDEFGMIRDVLFAQAGELWFIEAIRFGPIYWVFTATNYALVLSALVLLLRGRRTASALTRVQSLPLAIALIAPVITNVALISGIAPRAYDPMPFGVAVTALLLWWGAWRGRLLELVPLARGRLVDSLTDGILILDLEGRILDANPRLRALLDRSADSLVGQTLDTTLDAGTALGAAVRSVAQARAVTSVRHGASVFDVRAVPVPDHAGQVRAQVIVLQEVTERHELQEAQARLIEELRDALAQVRTLRGLLPICASCKCIRDDEGQWRTLELYISERTEADFTHGLCPTCITTLYPDDAGTGATR